MLDNKYSESFVFVFFLVVPMVSVAISVAVVLDQYAVGN